ncbi:MAG: DUF4111 domain-containing protein [Chloroflexi bacterium]|nr:DUF4111 domain-containing protein [Chloroflexota bacterium]
MVNLMRPPNASTRDTRPANVKAIYREMSIPGSAQIAESSQVAEVLNSLVTGVSGVLQNNLVGIYLYGSLVTEDFDAGISDLDLVVVTNLGLGDAAFASLQELHQQVIGSYPAWDDRLELAYVSLDALRTFRERQSLIAIISPGEPFHQLHAGYDWLISWYMLRETGIALRGPDIASLIDPIEPAHYIEAVQSHIEAYRDSVESANNKSNLSYIVLTTARGLYTVLHGQPTSKVKAAAWAARAFPKWARLINQALRWRINPQSDSPSVDEFRPSVGAFVNELLAMLPQKEDAAKAKSAPDT